MMVNESIEQPMTDNFKVQKALINRYFSSIACNDIKKLDNQTVRCH